MSIKDPTNSMPWLFPNLENYSHLLLSLTFKLKSDLSYNLKSKSFLLKIFTEGFDGLIFYMYQSPGFLISNVLENPPEMSHQLQISLKNKSSNLNEHFYFYLIPFGYIKIDNSFKFGVEIDKFDVIKELFVWSPSFLFKKIKSIIKINNTYQEIYPKFNFPLTCFHLDSWFKANETRFISDFINLLAKIENMDIPDFELRTKDVKNIINKSNEYLFETSEQDRYEDPSYIIKELTRLKNSVEILSKSKIIKWLDDIIEYYSNQLHKKPL